MCSLRLREGIFVLQVTPHIYCCRSGNAAHTQAVTDFVKYQLDVIRFKEEKKPTVHRAAQVRVL